MKRRTLVKWGIAASTAAGLGVSAGASIGSADVTALRQAAARLYCLDQLHGGDTIWQAAVAQAHYATVLLERGSYSESVGNAMLSATGDLHLCAGWLALDAGQHDVARTCYSNALTVSRQAGDTAIESVALADLAMQSTALFRPREALRYATGAEHAASAQRDLWIGVLPHVRTAVASAALGDAREADRAVSDARRALDRAEGTARPEWATFLSHAELDGIAGTCAGKLGDAARGERLIERALSGYHHESVRNVALLRVRLAGARLDGGAVDGAAEAANAALDDLADNVVSWRVSSELDAVAERLAEYSTAEAFLARYRSGAHA